MAHSGALSDLSIGSITIDEADANGAKIDRNAEGYRAIESFDLAAIKAILVANPDVAALYEAKVTADKALADALWAVISPSL